jgi:hypothetical protein
VERSPSLKAQLERLSFSSVELLPILSAIHSTAPANRPEVLLYKLSAVMVLLWQRISRRISADSLSCNEVYDKSSSLINVDVL